MGAFSEQYARGTVTAPDRLSAIADLWTLLAAAAEEGDRDAILFLRGFQPYAQAQLGKPC